MKSSIVPLSTVSPDLLIAFLEGRGVDPVTIRWKYFDEAFARGRERGFAWLSKGRVRGFIGMIPVTLATPDGDRDMVWTCDWFLEDPARSPGIGVKLLSRVREDYGLVGGVGGSEDTHRIVPEMDTVAVEGASVYLHRALRLGALLEKVEDRLAFLPKLSRTAVGRVRIGGKSGRSGDVAILEGVAPAMGGLFDRPADPHCRVRYSQEHLEWCLGRCPHVVTLSLLLGDHAAPNAAALLWRHCDDRSRWRASYRSDGAGLDPLLAAAAARASAEGGAVISTVVSSLDGDQIERLKRNAYLEGSVRWPLYLLTLEEIGACRHGFSGMSYLDTDLACLF